VRRAWEDRSLVVSSQGWAVEHGRSATCGAAARAQTAGRRRVECGLAADRRRDRRSGGGGRAGLERFVTGHCDGGGAAVGFGVGVIGAVRVSVAHAQRLGVVGRVDIRAAVDDAEAGVIGAAPDGQPLTKEAVAATYQNSADALKSLTQLDYKDGAFRDYQTGDAKYHVVVRLWHFGTAQSAKAWFQGELPDPAAKSFPVSGFPDAKGWYLPPLAPGDPANLQGLFYVGDVCFEIFVIGEDPIDRNVLADRIRKQVDRLTKGA
jgi:hypothetical protein